MENYINYMGVYSTSGDVKTALDNGDLNKPYVALVNGNVDFNTLEGEIDYSNIPLTFDVISGGTIIFKALDEEDVRTIEYKKNNGNWTEITSSTGGTEISVEAGDVVELRGNNSSYCGEMWTTNNFGSSTAIVNVYGNIMSLIDSTGYTTVFSFPSDTSNNLYRLFEGYVGLIDASNLVLPATALTSDCYGGMFAGCTGLITAPALPATTLADFCYEGMFQGCTSLTTAPELPAPTLAQFCYMDMFTGCSILNYIKCLATDISAESCTEGWVTSVASSGTFVKASSMSSWTTGSSGIPNNWTVQDAS